MSADTLTVVDNRTGAEYTLPIVDGAVHATELVGAERDAIFARQAARFAVFAEYARKLSRTIPVIRLERQIS